MTPLAPSRKTNVDGLDGDDAALLALLRQLKERGYQFVTPTPASHARIVSRASRQEGRNLRDVFGWSVPFEPAAIDPEILETLIAGDALDRLDDGRLKSRYRVSTLGGDFFLHSAYPTDAAGRDYRDGGDMHGGRVACDMADKALDRLSPDGCFILYTGSAIIEGEDPLRDTLAAIASRKRCTIRYREIDPDMFGEELERPTYREVERIAIVGAVFSREDQAGHSTM